MDYVEKGCSFQLLDKISIFTLHSRNIKQQPALSFDTTSPQRLGTYQLMQNQDFKLSGIN